MIKKIAPKVILVFAAYTIWHLGLGDGAAFLVNKNIETGRSSEPQLYNPEKDLGEQHNLAEEYPEKAGELASLLQDIVDKGSSRSETPFFWNNANIYFLLTDRFYNGDPSNDLNFDRTAKTAKLRGFEGGDMKGVIQKIEEGYFNKLGITALWLTPCFEQIHGNTDEGSGVTYGYHGYWTKDWTSIDPNFGTEEDLFKLVETAHSHGIRIIMDVIINHTGPVTDKDPVWPGEWVRTSPKCTYQSYETTVTCTLVDNLPDIRTESEGPVDLPPQLLEKWEKEGRLEKEMAELDAFFERTGYPRAPRYYIIKWLTDVIRKYGIDGYRLDTAKHIEEGVWSELGSEARVAFMDWKKEHPDKVLDDNDFYMVAEVYGYGISSGRNFSFGDRDVDFFAHAINSMINFEFKHNATGSYEKLFSTCSDQLNGVLVGKSVLNYMTSHDDGEPFDKERIKPMEAATKLLLSPGASQIYYGDESCRELIIPGTNGDATLRGLMNWEEIESDASRNGYSIRKVMDHYQKLGTFRSAHPSVGAGIHRMITETPYVFSRSFTTGEYSDHVVAGLDLDPGKKSFEVGEFFEDGARLYDYYSGKYTMVKNGKIELTSAESIVLLGTGNPNPSPEHSGCALALVVNDTPYIIDFGPGLIRKTAALTPGYGGSIDGLEIKGIKTPDKVIVISGDCTPSEKLMEYADGADILVHEVYSEAGFDTKPQAWKEYHRVHHTSTVELARIASRAKPGKVVLYHILFRGASEQEILDEIVSGYSGTVIVGRDLDIF